MQKAARNTFRIQANTEEELHDLLVRYARGLDDPDRILAVRLGDKFACVDVWTGPLVPKHLH